MKVELMSEEMTPKKSVSILKAMKSKRRMKQLSVLLIMRNINEESDTLHQSQSKKQQQAI
jgi:hypothetical protein